MIENLRRWSPRVAEILGGLDEWTLEHLQIAVPLDGGRPYFAIAQGGSVMLPADPEELALFREMDDILWNKARAKCLEVMAEVQNYQYYTPAPHEEPEVEWIDVTAVEVVPEERRLT